MRLDAQGSFDTFNPVLPEGEPADGIGLVYESLTERALDDTSASYGHIAEAWAYPARLFVHHLPHEPAGRSGRTASRSRPRT